MKIEAYLHFLLETKEKKIYDCINKYIYTSRSLHGIEEFLTLKKRKEINELYPQIRSVSQKCSVLEC